MITIIVGVVAVVDVVDLGLERHLHIEPLLSKLLLW